MSRRTSVPPRIAFVAVAFLVVPNCSSTHNEKQSVRAAEPTGVTLPAIVLNKLSDGSLTVTGHWVLKMSEAPTGQLPFGARPLNSTILRCWPSKRTCEEYRAQIFKLKASCSRWNPCRLKSSLGVAKRSLLRRTWLPACDICSTSTRRANGWSWNFAVSQAPVAGGCLNDSSWSRRQIPLLGDSTRIEPGGNGRTPSRSSLSAVAGRLRQT